MIRNIRRGDAQYEVQLEALIGGGAYEVGRVGEMMVSVTLRVLPKAWAKFTICDPRSML